MLLLLDISGPLLPKILSAFDQLKCMRKADFDVPLLLALWFRLLYSLKGSI